MPRLNNLLFSFKSGLAVVAIFFGLSLHAQSSSLSKSEKDSISAWLERSQDFINSDGHKAIVLAERALELAKRKSSSIYIAESEWALGMIYRGTSLDNKAISHFENSIEAYAKTDSVAKRLRVERRLGRAYYAVGNYPKAMNVYMESLSEYEKLKIRNSDLAWLLRYIGSVFNREENYVKAMEYYVEAFKVFKEMEDNGGMASCYNTIGNVYLLIEDYPKALDNYKNALDLAKRTKDDSRVSVIQENIGETYLLKGDYTKAHEYYLKSYSYLIDSVGHSLDYSLLSQNRVAFGDLHRLQKEYDEALKYYDSAEKFAMKSDRKRSLRLESVFEGRYKTYELLNNNELALKYYKLYRDYNDSLQGSSVVNLINEIEANYMSAKGKRLIDALNTEKDQLFVEKENEKASAQRAWAWIIWLVMGMIGIVIFFMVIIMQKRKIEAANVSLVGQNLEAVKSEQKIKQLETETVKKEVAKEADSESSQSSKYSKSALLDEQKEELLNRLNKLMEEDEIYKKKDLTVVGVAKILKTNKSYISQVINEYLGMNFSSYVNEYRVKEARRLLSDKKYHHLKIESIAGDSGFNSVSAFNNAYKKFTGLTPSYYLKSIIERDENA